MEEPLHIGRIGRVVLGLGVCLILANACVTSETKPPDPATPVALDCPPAFDGVSHDGEYTPVGPVYYVATNEPQASDSNNGRHPTFEGGNNGPWLTIHHATNTVRAGATVYIREGIYYESGISFANSGSPDAPIFLMNYESEEVIIDGSQATDESPGILILGGYGNFVIQGLIIRNMPWSGIATDGATASPYRGITIRDCLIYDNGWSGIDLAAVDGFVVENVRAHSNEFYGLNISGSEDGLVSASNGVVRNSIFYNHIGKEGHGVAINQGHDIALSDSVACHNTIHGFDISDWPKSGESSYNIVVERNMSYENGVAGYAVNSNSHHVVYRSNIAWHNGADWAGKGSSSGFLCYEDCWHIEWFNNVSYGNSDAGFYVEDLRERYGAAGDSSIVFQNNVAFANGRPGSDQRFALVVEGEQWDVVATHNNWGGVEGYDAMVVAVNVEGRKGTVFKRNEISDGAFQVGNLSADPEFIDVSAADWQLQPGSPMIDAGIDVGLPFCGDAPDIGAFEACP